MPRRASGSHGAADAELAVTTPRVRCTSWCLGAFLATSLSGCLDILVTDCTAEFVYGIRLEVRDSQTLEPVRDGLSGIQTDGGSTDPLEVWDHILVGAGERTGLFAVRVEASGYEPWERTGIRVRHDGCHPVPVEIDVLLEPDSTP